MKYQIRKSAFETNSSSTHTLTICTQDEFDQFKQGKKVYVYGLYGDKLEELQEPQDDDYSEQETYEQFFADDMMETYMKQYTTPNGEKIVVFGKYGYQ